MNKEVIYTIKSLYREDMGINGYRFGKGKKSVCIVGAIRGNEVQQLYICSRLVSTLKHLEEAGAIAEDREILVIPSVNHYSMNVSKRFWGNDNTDINRMFPGYSLGETTQRIADGVFQAVQGYEYGIQFASFYMPGDFMPHVRMMETGYHSPELGSLFGLPYVVLRKPSPFDTTTLNYNWQIWDTKAFSVYTNETNQIDEESAKMAVTAVLRFMAKAGILHYKCCAGYQSSVIREQEMVTISSDCGGIFRRLVHHGEEIASGQPLAEIIDPFEGEVKTVIYAPVEGVVFFTHNNPLVMESTAIFKIIRRENL